MPFEKEAENKMKSTLDHLQKELTTIRTGRADPSMFDNLEIDVYGSKMTLKNLSTVSIPESRQLLITPFDANNVNSIAKIIEKSNFNLNPILEGNALRINIPPMDEKQRIEKAKLAKQKGEEAKVSIRNIRREYNDLLKVNKQSGDITEDLQKKGEKNIQTLTDRFCKSSDEMIKEKEKDILTV